MANLIFAKRQQLEADKLVGSFTEVSKGRTVNAGVNNFANGTNNLWCSITDPVEGTVLVRVAKSVGRSVLKALEGVTDADERLGTALKAFSDCDIYETVQRNAPEPGQALGSIKIDPATNEPMKGFIMIYAGQRGLSEAAVSATISKAASFSLRTAMTHRI